ncbi:MAG: metal-sensitive transcriptional regulator [Anaerolineales bacterium]|nr:metal-sensitive transcriptional regulator [Anaerolineales bacterium]MCB9127608.1 metal-sensitive transcriptional regulator [Ardenticatenales bacterium]
MSQDTTTLLRRLRTIEGHVRAVQRMVEEEAYCIDIIHQTQAIKSALNKVEEQVLADHLQGCVTTAIRSDEAAERERVIGELMDLFKASNKR